MIFRRRRTDLTQPETVLATVTRLEVLTDRLEETTQTLKEMLEMIHKEDLSDQRAGL